MRISSVNSGGVMMFVLIKFRVWVIKLYGDKNERSFAENTFAYSTHLEYLTAKEILPDWKQSLGLG